MVTFYFEFSFVCIDCLYLRYMVVLRLVGLIGIAVGVCMVVVCYIVVLVVRCVCWVFD